MNPKAIVFLFLGACTGSPTAPTLSDAERDGSRQDVGERDGSSFGDAERDLTTVEDTSVPDMVLLDANSTEPILESVTTFETTIGGTLVGLPVGAPANGVPFATRSDLDGGPTSTWLTDIRIMPNGSVEIERGTAGTALTVAVHVAEFNAEVAKVSFNLPVGSLEGEAFVNVPTNRNAFGVFHYRVNNVNADQSSSMIRMEVADGAGFRAIFSRLGSVGRIEGTLYVVHDPSISVMHLPNDRTNAPAVTFPIGNPDSPWLMASYSNNANALADAFWRCGVSSGTGVCERAASGTDVEFAFQIIDWGVGEIVTYPEYEFASGTFVAAGVPPAFAVSPLNGRGGAMRCETSDPQQTPAGCLGQLVGAGILRNEAREGASTWLQSLEVPTDL